MGAEFWAVIGVGVTVLVAIGAGQRETKRRFDEVSRRFDDMNRRIDELAQRLTRLEGAFDEMHRWTKNLLEAVLRRPAA